MSNVIKAVIGVVVAIIVIKMTWGIVATAVSGAITIAIVATVGYLVYQGIKSIGGTRRNQIGR